MPGPAAPGPGPDPEESYDFLFKLVLIGDASVGKTCLVQRFKTGAFAERQGSTIGVDFTMKSLEIQGKRVKVSGAAEGAAQGPAAAGRGAAARLPARRRGAAGQRSRRDAGGALARPDCRRKRRWRDSGWRRAGPPAREPRLGAAPLPCAVPRQPVRGCPVPGLPSCRGSSRGRGGPEPPVKGLCPSRAGSASAPPEQG